MPWYLSMTHGIDRKFEAPSDEAAIAQGERECHVPEVHRGNLVPGEHGGLTSVFRLVRAGAMARCVPLNVHAKARGAHRPVDAPPGLE